MKRFLVGLAMAAVAVIGLGSVAASAAATQLQTFGTGTVTITGADSATILNATGQYGGVFINSRSQSGKALSAISFSFVSTGDVSGGAPRFSIPIDTDGIGSTDNGYAFLDVLGCGYTKGTVSTTLSNCHVNFNSVDYTNWDTFAALNPTYRLAPGFIPFIIADEPGSYAVNSIDLR
jgi:hypothetical protein